MSLLGKYRKETEKEDEEEKPTRLVPGETVPIAKQSELLSFYKYCLKWGLIRT